MTYVRTAGTAFDALDRRPVPLGNVAPVQLGQSYDEQLSPSQQYCSHVCGPMALQPVLAVGFPKQTAPCQLQMSCSQDGCAAAFCGVAARSPNVAPDTEAAKARLARAS